MKASKIDDFIASKNRKESFLLNQGYPPPTWNRMMQSKYIVNYICWSFSFRVVRKYTMSRDNDRYVVAIYEGI